MKKFEGYAEIKGFAEQEKLPKGGYIVKILNVEEVTYSWGSVLKMDFDIEEGDYKGFYQKNYDTQTQEDKKWKGSYRLPIPKDDGTEQDGWTKSRFKATMEALEQSNPSYTWDWDETKLKGKQIGGLFNLKEWEFNGSSGWTSQCKRFVPIELIQKETFTLPKDEPLKKENTFNTSQTSTDGFMKIDNGIKEELPF